MTSRDTPYVRRQQSYWLKHDAARWIRPDWARFYKPGTTFEEAFPALARKYSASQPRVPSGSGRESGRWTSGSASGRPRVIIDTTNLDNEADDGRGDADASASFTDSDGSGFPDESGSDSTFGISPRDDDERVQLVSDQPRGSGDNGGPPLELPDIPETRPDTRKDRMQFLRDGIRWLGRVGRYSAAADAFLGALDQITELGRIADAMKTANDPSRSFEDLRERATYPSEPGYQNHHIAEENAARISGYPKT